MAQGKEDQSLSVLTHYNCALDDVHDLRPLDVSRGAIYLLKKRLKEHRQLEQSSEVADELSILFIFLLFFLVPPPAYPVPALSLFLGPLFPKPSLSSSSSSSSSSFSS